MTRLSALPHETLQKAKALSAHVVAVSKPAASGAILPVALAALSRAPFAFAVTAVLALAALLLPLLHAVLAWPGALLALWLAALVTGVAEFRLRGAAERIRSLERQLGEAHEAASVRDRDILMRIRKAAETPAALDSAEVGGATPRPLEAAAAASTRSRFH